MLTEDNESTHRIKIDPFKWIDNEPSFHRFRLYSCGPSGGSMYLDYTELPKLEKAIAELKRRVEEEK